MIFSIDILVNVNGVEHRTLTRNFKSLQSKRDFENNLVDFLISRSFSHTFTESPSQSEKSAIRRMTPPPSLSDRKSGRQRGSPRVPNSRVVRGKADPPSSSATNSTTDALFDEKENSSALQNLPSLDGGRGCPEIPTFRCVNLVKPKTPVRETTPRTSQLASLKRALVAAERSVIRPPEKSAQTKFQSFRARNLIHPCPQRIEREKSGEPRNWRERSSSLRNEYLNRIAKMGTVSTGTPVRKRSFQC